MNRRSFVKTAVGVAGASALAASGLSLAAGLAIPRAAAGGLLTYWGAHRVAGPAPRGIPFIPVTVEDGTFVGKTTLPPPPGADSTEPINVLEWYKYCGHSGAPGLRPDFTDANELVYLAKDDYNIVTPWFKDLLNQPVKESDFPANGFGAAFRWRSEGQEGAAIISGVLIRAEPSRIRESFVPSPVAPARPLASAEEYEWVKENIWYTPDEGKTYFIGVSTYCTHFCCTPGYREAEALARPRNAWDNIFCTCHNSNYNFAEPVRYTFAPEIATEAGGFDPLLTRGGGEGGAH